MQSGDLTTIHPITTIRPHQLFQGKLLGSGGFGIVYDGKYRGRKVAIKILKRLDPKSIEKFENEYNIMAQFKHANHANIVEAIGFLHKNHEYKIIMEFMDGGDLTSLLQSKQKLSWVFRRHIAYNIAKGIAYLHEHNLAHRDLKPDNIFLTRENQVKIGDFGCANFKSSSSTFGSFAGTYRYTGPEHIENVDGRIKGSFQGDIYSLALTIWEICSRTKPWEQIDLFQMVKRVLNKERPPLDKAFPMQFLQIIEQGWTHDPKNRPTIKEIIEILENNPLPYEEKKFDGGQIDHPGDQLKLLEEILAGDAMVEISFKGWEILTDNLLISVCKNFSSLTILDLSDCPNLSTIGLQAIANHCPKLSRLSIHNWTQLFSIPKLDFPHLTSLEMDNCCNLDSLSLDAPLLTSLSLRNCSSLKKIDDKLPVLRELFLDGCTELDAPSFFDFIQGCQNLQQLTMDGYDFKKFGHHEVPNQSKSFFHIGCIVPDDAKFVDYNLFQRVPLLLKNPLNRFQGPVFEAILSFLTSGTVLSFKNLKIRKEDLQIIIQTLSSQSLTTVNFTDNQFEDGCFKPIVEAIGTNHSITKIQFSNQVSLEDTSTIAKAIASNPSLTSISIQKNTISDKGAKLLGDAIARHPSMAKITFKGNKIGLKGIKQIAEGLALTSKVTRINFSNNGIKNGGRPLFEVIGTNTSITHVNLKGNAIYSTGAGFIAKAISINPALISLNLEDNSIGNDGVREIAAALKEHPTLEHINFGSNWITDKGVEDLSTALKFNHSITSIDLHGNWIRSPAIQVFTKALESNPNNKVRSLNFAHNWIGNRGTRAVAKFLPESSLTFVNLARNSIGLEETRFLIETLAANPTISPEINLSRNHLNEMHWEAFKNIWIEKGRDPKDLKITW